MQIRRATSTDAEVVSQMRADFVAEVRGLDPAALDAGFLAATATFVHLGLADGSLVTWVATDYDAVLGVVSLQLQPVPPRPDDLRRHEGYVLNMYVVPASRGRGVGRALFEACLASADELDVRRFHLLATPEGRPLYESTGFVANPDVLERRVALPVDPAADHPRAAARR